MSVRIHDLLEIDAERFLQGQSSAPGWVAESLREAPFVVVRRGSTEQGIPVGIRGARRNERCAGVCQPEMVRRILTPPTLLRLVAPASQMDRVSHTDFASQAAFSTSLTPVCQAPSARRFDTIPALRALPLLAERWRDLAAPWGPGGSVGFELATGRHVTSPESDLDVVIYANTPMTASTAQTLRDRAQGLPAAVDVRLETPICGFSLTEYASRSPTPILIRLASGTALAADPWAATPDLPARRPVTVRSK
jgi:phosphoribosyl-dephospho-CoA transferase